MVFRVQGMPYLPGCVQGRLLRGLAGDAGSSISVVTGRDLPLQGPRPRGIIVVDGAPLSHPMLRLRGLGAPIVLIDSDAAARLPYGDIVTLDGASGVISTETLPSAGRSPPAPGTRTLTLDGTAVELYASIGNAAGAAAAVAAGASAIGLVRSEYLFPASGEQPDAAFLKAALREVCQAARPLPVTVRLLDVAGDKRPPWVRDLRGLGGVLGLQGARLYDLEPIRSVLHAELEALGALAGQYELRALIPYLTRLEELEHWHDGIQAHLRQPVPVGAMLETPAAALAVSGWLQTADFVALGCNDLMQCLFAADRDQPEVAHLLDPYSPSLYNFLRHTAQEAGSNVAQIAVCGLLAQLPGVLPLFLGLGFRRFSVDPAMIPWLAETASSVSVREAATLAHAVCRARHSADVRDLLKVKIC